MRRFNVGLFARAVRARRSVARVIASLLLVGAYAACAAFIRDARKAGLTVPIANVSFVGSESMLQLLVATSKADGRDYTTNLVNSQVVPSYENPSVPVVKEYLTLMDKYQPATPAGLADADYKPLRHSFVSLEGFLNAKLLVEVLKRMGANPQRTKIEQTVAGIDGFELGMGRPITFAGQSNQGSDAIYYTTVEDGRFVPIRDWKAWRK